MDLVAVGINPTFEDECITNGANAEVPKNYAITVRHAFTQYVDVLKNIATGGALTNNVVLKNFNMTVEKGHIYALLGASGCGKTTILRAIIGRHHLTSGEIRVLGQLVGACHNKRPIDSAMSAANIGYMPQEVSLLEKFTIKETFYYYGQLVGMTNEKITAERNKLARLLDLPSIHRSTCTLSGGQRRRVSLAIALLHSPPILILDEPTVGLDPVLRESILHYLKTIAKRSETTVLITTHYIAEATWADTVGIMRHGELIAEESPHTLLKSFKGRDLEEVVLKLSLQQSTRSSPISSVSDSQEQTTLPVNDSDVTFEMASTAKKDVPSFKRISALFWKDMIWYTRNPVYVSSLLLLPAIIICGVSIVNREPTGMRVSVFNQDSNCFQEKHQTTNDLKEMFNCSLPADLSCEILKFLEKRKIRAVTSDSDESAKDDVIKGRSWAAVTFASNFSSALIGRLRYSSPSEVTAEMIDSGSIHVEMDQSDRIMSFSIQTDIVDAMLKLLSDFDDVCHTITHMKKIPIRFNSPVFGYSGTSRADYVYPSVITSLAFLLPLTATICSLLPAKLEGTLERSFVSGVTTMEVLSANIIACIPLTIVQVFILLLIPYKILNFYFAGNIWIGALLLIHLGNAGMIFGFVTTIMSSSVNTATGIAMGLYFIFLFTGGLAWPLDGVPSPVRELCYAMPLTYPSEALRHISLRGWSLLNRTPQLAIASTTIWMLFFLLLLMIFIKRHAI